MRCCVHQSSACHLHEEGGDADGGQDGARDPASNLALEGAGRDEGALHKPLDMHLPKREASKDGRARVELRWCGVDCIRVEAHQRPGNPRVGERFAVRRHRRSVASLGLAIREVREAEKSDAKGLGELLPTRGRTRIVLQ